GYARGRHADEDDRAGARGHGEGLRDRRLGTDGDEDVVGAAAGQATHLLDGVGRAGVHAMGGAEAAGGLQLALDEIERDHHARTGDGGALYGVQADAAGPDDGGGGAGAQAGGVGDSAEASDDAAGEQRRRIKRDRGW